MAVEMLPGFEQCPGCDRVVVPTWSFCPMCGTALDFDEQQATDKDADIDAALEDTDTSAEEIVEDLEQTAQEEVTQTFSVDEDGVLAALEEHGGEVPQAEFTDLLDTYQSKVSLLLSDLEADGVIERERMEGRHAGKVVRLPDDHDASADPDEDAADASEDDDELEDLHTEPQDETADADPPATTNTEPEHLDPDDPEDLQRAYNEADNLAEVARRFPMGRTAIMQRLAAHGILDESDRETGVKVQSLDLSQYGQSGQVVTPEMLIEALDGAQALYHVKRELRLADREIEDICRHLDLLEDLRNGTGKLDRPTVEAAVWQAVET